jgi:hypothetical protein
MALRHYNCTYQTIFIDSGLQWEIMVRSDRLATSSIHRDAAGYAHSPGQRIDPAAAEEEIWLCTRALAGRAAMSHRFGEIVSINLRVGVFVVRRAIWASVRYFLLLDQLLPQRSVFFVS